LVFFSGCCYGGSKRLSFLSSEAHKRPADYITGLNPSTFSRSFGMLSIIKVLEFFLGGSFNSSSSSSSSEESKLYLLILSKESPLLFSSSSFFLMAYS
jgi:hypothetical protein